MYIMTFLYLKKPKFVYIYTPMRYTWMIKFVCIENKNRMKLKIKKIFFDFISGINHISRHNFLKYIYNII